MIGDRAKIESICFGHLIDDLKGRSELYMTLGVQRVDMQIAVRADFRAWQRFISDKAGKRVFIRPPEIVIDDDPPLVSP